MNHLVNHEIIIQLAPCIRSITSDLSPCPLILVWIFLYISVLCLIPWTVSRSICWTKFKLWRFNTSHIPFTFCQEMLSQTCSFFHVSSEIIISLNLVKVTRGLKRKSKSKPSVLANKALAPTEQALKSFFFFFNQKQLNQQFQTQSEMIFLW